MHRISALWLAMLAGLTAASLLAAPADKKPKEVPPVTPKMRPVAWDPAPLPRIEVRATRPRIWFTAEQVPELRKRCQTTCRAALEHVVAEAKKPGVRDNVAALDLAFLYQMTGDASYARKAIDITKKGQPFDWISYNGAKYSCGGQHAGAADPAACVFDWCYDQLTDAEKQTIGQRVRTEMARGPFRMEFHESYWIPTSISQMLALYGSGIDDKLAAEHLASLNRIVHQWAVVADAIHADSSSGDYHHQFNFHWNTAEIWLQGTGENLFKSCGYLRTQPAYNMYLALPDGHWIPNDGDGNTDPEGGCAVTFWPHQGTFGYYGLRNDNPYARWFARHWRDQACRSEKGGGGTWWQKILYYDPSTEERPISEMPKVKLFPSNKVAFMRSGWDLTKNSKDIVAGLYCRPDGGHSHLDAGHFVIWRGLDQLAQRNGFYGNPGSKFQENYFARSIAHNCMTILDPGEKPGYRGTARDGGQLGGDRQYYPASAHLLHAWGFRGEIYNFTDKPQFCYLFADMTPAYAATKASRVQRAFLWLKPATFLVCDWATSTRPEFKKRWLLNVAAKPAIDGHDRVVAGTAEAGILESSDTRVLTVARGTSKLFMQPLLPAATLVRRLGGEGYAYWCDGKNWDPFDCPLGPQMRRGEKAAMDQYARKFWRIEIEASRPATEDVFLTLLDATEAQAGSPPSTAKLLHQGEAVGAEVKTADSVRTVLFYPDGRASVDGTLVGERHEPLKPLSGEQADHR